ncbi:hypothetical protein C8Q80DRAFT_877052 [Daedaleopsis nitida]|nr:hypothetical protein C8Q80DRAFT_877052 [Daedaleopsis nitida]
MRSCYVLSRRSPTDRGIRDQASEQFTDPFVTRHFFPTTSSSSTARRISFLRPSRDRRAEEHVVPRIHHRRHLARKEAPRRHTPGPMRKKPSRRPRTHGRENAEKLSVEARDCQCHAREGRGGMRVCGTGPGFGVARVVTRSRADMSTVPANAEHAPRGLISAQGEGGRRVEEGGARKER